MASSLAARPVPAPLRPAASEHRVGTPGATAKLHRLLGGFCPSDGRPISGDAIQQAGRHDIEASGECNPNDNRLDVS
jgi:hypothetical protein